MSSTSNQQLVKLIQSMIVERQRLLIREASYPRGLVGLPPVRASDRSIGPDASEPRGGENPPPDVPPDGRA